MLDNHARDLASLPPTEYALLAADGQVLLAQPLPGVTAQDRAWFSAPAHVLPLLAWLQQHPAYVSVVTDRAGAEVTAVPSGALTGTTRTVVGPDDEIERNSPGGWSQARYQRRAEDSWHHNAVAVADTVVRALDEVKTRLLLVAGDVRAVQMLGDHLNKHTHRNLRIRRLPGGRSRDGSSAARQDAVAKAVADELAARNTALLEEFQQRLGPGGDAVEGISATLTALAEGRLRTLLVGDDPSDGRTAWLGPETLCAEHADTGQATWVMAGRLPDVAVRAALLTDADVHVLPPAEAMALDDGIGGLCRFGRSAPTAKGA